MPTCATVTARIRACGRLPKPQCEAVNESLTDARGAPRRRGANYRANYADLDEDTKPAAQELDDDYEDDNCARDYIEL
jgi:hypothetical protein